MQLKHAAIAGISVGLLCGIAICTVVGVSLADALFRIFILAVGGAWMGVLLVWLNDLLTPAPEEKMADGRRRHRS